MACVLCTSSLNIFTRKKCSQCQRIHCSKCSRRFLSAGVCAFCFRLLSLSFNRQDLDQYTVKELRQFLILNNCCTDGFKERADLVEAVMKLKCPQNQASDNAEHVHHVQQLKERMTRENSNDRSNASSSSTSPSSADESNSAPATSSMSSSSSPRIDEDSNTSSGLGDTSSPSALPAELEPSADRAASFTSASRVLSEPPEATSSLGAGQAPKSDPVFGAPSRRMTLNQLSKEEDIDNLSVRQLKELLITNYVDYKGCCERQELMERVRRLWTDDQKNKGIKISEEESSSEIDLCKICMDSVIDCILLECGHMVTCTQCGKLMAECPICRLYVSRVVHVFKA